MLFSLSLVGQNAQTITGKVVDGFGNPIPDVLVGIEATNSSTFTDSLGDFQLSAQVKSVIILNLSKQDYITQRIPIEPSTTSSFIALESIVLEKDITFEKTDNLITLTDGDLSDDSESTSVSAGLLQATRDVFLNRAAFDFGQAFFRVKGYDSRNGQVLINGMRMNKFFDGRPQWNNWGGLNDVIRNQEFSNGLEASSYGFGGILGTTNIDLRPSGLRSGTRISSSFSNRTYAARLMATHTSALSKQGLAYTLSASRRWANQGYINGTLYDAYSLYGSLEYQLTDAHTLSATAILARNRRGRSSAVTEEVVALAGKRYNPSWGRQEGGIRNAREREVFEPLFMVNHFFKGDTWSITSGMAYQFGQNSRSRLGYFNAPNPDPTYFRYLPSFYINNSIGADFTNANLAREGFRANPQINWQQLYTANQNQEKAAYLVSDDVNQDKLLHINSTANLTISPKTQLDLGVAYRSLLSKNFAEIKDLLGAQFHEDIDPFSDTRNDISGSLNKLEGDTFNYHYNLRASDVDAFAQLSYNTDRWNAFTAVNYARTQYQREGIFQNQRYLDNSLGKGRLLQFNTLGLKTGGTYSLSGRHAIRAHFAYLQRPPLSQNTFINPRENNDIVQNVQSETVTSVDLNYFLRLPDLTARLTGFYTRFQNGTDVNFFFVDAGVGSDFVQEVLTQLDQLHKGVELGLEYQASATVKLSFVGNLGSYVFASNPNVSINFDTAGAEEDLINLDGSIDLGAANIKGLRLAQGPQQAYALGVEYRDPKYWWIAGTANYLTDNYANISTITRTQSFFLNPETGARFPEATPDNVAKLLQQRPLDSFYLLNLVGGKSWLKDGRYISIFASINNLFDTSFRTGGFEQSRNGNFGQLQQDNLRNDPSFAPRYWYGFGRTFFLNFAISF